MAHAAPQGTERQTVATVLTEELRAALQAQNVLALHADAVEARVQDYLPSFFDGTFGLCVAEPSTGSGIVRKEILQERLSVLHKAMSEGAPSGMPTAALLQLIDDYAAAAMPFSPVDYPSSSRKRLVADFSAIVAA